MFALQNQIAIVTGGAKGFGKGIDYNLKLFTEYETKNDNNKGYYFLIDKFK